MSDGLDPAPLPEGLGIPPEDWHQTPLSVRLVVLTLLKRLEALETRLKQDSSNSNRPPSTDSPSTKRQRRMTAATRRKPGGKPGHPGHPQVLLDLPQPSRFFQRSVPVASVSLWSSPRITRIRSLNCLWVFLDV